MTDLSDWLLWRHSCSFLTVLPILSLLHLYLLPFLPSLPCRYPMYTIYPFFLFLAVFSVCFVAPKLLALPFPSYKTLACIARTGQLRTSPFLPSLPCRYPMYTIYPFLFYFLLYFPYIFQLLNYFLFISFSYKTPACIACTGRLRTNPYTYLCFLLDSQRPLFIPFPPTLPIKQAGVFFPVLQRVSAWRPLRAETE